MPPQLLISLDHRKTQVVPGIVSDEGWPFVRHRSHSPKKWIECKNRFGSLLPSFNDIFYLCDVEVLGFLRGISLWRQFVVAGCRQCFGHASHGTPFALSAGPSWLVRPWMFSQSLSSNARESLLAACNLLGSHSSHRETSLSTSL